MTFASPIFLLALLAVPLALLAYVLLRRRQRRYAVRFPALETLMAVMPKVPAWRRNLPVGLFLAAIAVLAIALARPEAEVDVPREQATILLVTDSSRSMLATDVEPSRLEVARDAARGFVDDLPDGVRIGVVGFSDTPHTIEAPSTDKDRARDAIDGLDADGGTGTGDALNVALGLAGEGVKPGGKSPSAIVLLSDGKQTVGRNSEEVAAAAKRAGVPIHTVALGTSEGVVETPAGVIAVPPDPELMKAIARASGGRSFVAEEQDELKAVYDQLGSRVATRKEEREISALFAAGGLILLLGAAGFGLRSAGRLP
ncbi:MAG: VWA domain-containing protein [Thermoleophilaceae bacterium]|nr:VWA domain-containing protein [Thermoleophilaceae bacterium]